MGRLSYGAECRIAMKGLDMGEAFYQKASIRRLAELGKSSGGLFKAFSDFDAKVFAPGALTVRSKELMALACAHITRCPYCIDAHATRAKEAGASDAEIAEAIFVATAMSAGASLAHSCIALEALDKA